MAMNFGDMFDNAGEVLDPEFALLHEEGVDGLIRTISVAEFKRWTNNLARALLERGCEPGDKVAIYMRNRSEYIIATAAATKARLTHVNVNYRYKADELRYILENSDARCVVFDAEFEQTLDAVRGDLGQRPMFVAVTDGDTSVDWAASFQSLCSDGDGSPLDIKRSPEDQIFMYTGGTTGLPKGVVWEQGALWDMIGKHVLTPMEPAPQSPGDIDIPKEGAPHKNIIILPLMHGAGLYSAISAIGYGEAIVLMRTRRYDPELTLANIEKYRVSLITIAGDALAKPLVDTLESNPGKYDLSSLKGIRSSAMVLSPGNKEKLLKHCPNLMIVDAVGSSESTASAMNICNANTNFAAGEGALMQLTPDAKVFDENWQEVEPIAGNIGFLAVSGATPLGYYNDSEKTAQTMTEVNGVRYSRPGDFVEFQEGGMIKFLGRGNVCINTGGEKVYPEELEIAIKSHTGVADCLIVGVPDARLGEAITAVIELKEGAASEVEDYRSHVRAQLADYKVPKHVVFTPKVFRSDAGKADYTMTREFALAELGGSIKE